MLERNVIIKRAELARPLSAVLGEQPIALSLSFGSLAGDRSREMLLINHQSKPDRTRARLNLLRLAVNWLADACAVETVATRETSAGLALDLNVPLGTTRVLAASPKGNAQ